MFSKCNMTAAERAVSRVDGSVVARPGYFALSLANSVRVEMTASHRTSLFRFSFPQSGTAFNSDTNSSVPVSPLVLFDLSDLSRSRRDGGVQVYRNLRIAGDGLFGPSFGVGGYTAYFCADFRGLQPRNSGTFRGTVISDSVQHLDNIHQAWASNPDAGAWIRFAAGDGPLLVRVGLSFMSTDQACGNAVDEIPDFDFDRVVAAAERAWRGKLSGAVSVDMAGVDGDLLTTFWSGLYRTFLSPQNYTGENPLWRSQEPYFDSFYCIWDSFRAQHPLLTILDPAAQAEMIRTLLDVYRYLGKLPDCRMSFSKGFTQGGSNADIVIADAYIKELREGIDWDTAWRAVLSDAETPADDSRVEGRANLDHWLQLGYIAADAGDGFGPEPNMRSVSRTYEYAYDDFCVATLGKALGRRSEAARIMARSGFWRNLWNDTQQDLYPDYNSTGDRSHLLAMPEGVPLQSSGFVGFPQPRLASGRFGQQQPRACSELEAKHLCYLDTGLSTYEGSPWLYQFYVPQDMDGLMQLIGGPDGLVARLQYFHQSGMVDIGNEQAFLTLFQFHYAGRPGLSARWVRHYIPSRFAATPAGLPGNDDCAMGAFVAMAMMGFWPVPGQDVYLVVTPFFHQVRLRSRLGGWRRPAVIRKVGLHGRPAPHDAIYIQSARLNGEPLTRNWITHRFFLDGGTLELVVGNQESSWGTAVPDRPPSYPPPKT